MRGGDAKTEALVSYVSRERRIPVDHPLRPIQKIVDAALTALSAEFQEAVRQAGAATDCSGETASRPAVAGLLLGAGALMEQLGYNLLFRWFVGLSLDAVVWDVRVLTKNHARLIAGDIAAQVMAAVLNQEQITGLLSDDHFWWTTP
jgi:hypothetical protein